MRKKDLMAVAASAMLMALTACNNESSGALLECKVIGTAVEEGLVTYCPNGNIFENQMTEFEIGKDSVFSYNTELKGETGDVTVEMAGIGYFGVHLVKGKTVKMTVEKVGDQWEARFEGPDADVSQYFNSNFAEDCDEVA